MAKKKFSTKERLLQQKTGRLKTFEDALKKGKLPSKHFFLGKGEVTRTKVQGEIKRLKTQIQQLTQPSNVLRSKVSRRRRPN